MRAQVVCCCWLCVSRHNFGSPACRAQARRTTARDRLAVERSTYDPERRAAAASSVESRSRRSPLAAALPPIAPAVEVSSRNHDRPPRLGNACFGAPGRLG